MRLFVDALTVLDCSYLHPARGLVGESWLVDIELGGQLDDQGMMMDFGLVKKHIKQALDASIDHRLLIPMQSTAMGWNTHSPHPALTFTCDDGTHIHHQSPEEALCRIESHAITTESVTQKALDIVREVVSDNVTDIRLTLRHEDINTPYYHYSHGLKKHEGNCQRIAHGHRSRIEIWQDELRSPALETEWSQRWRDIYIGTEDDIAERTTENGQEYLTFHYRAQQGDFALSLPADRCYIITTDSTVEWLADHIAQQLALAYPGHRYRVRAYEGFQKGALAEST